LSSSTSAGAIVALVAFCHAQQAVEASLIDTRLLGSLLGRGRRANDWDSSMDNCTAPEIYEDKTNETGANETGTSTYMTYLPNDVDSAEHEWLVQRSEKNQFTFQPGKILSKGVIKRPYRPTTWTLDDAKQFCHNHPECAGFSFPMSGQANDLETIERIKFYPSVNGIRMVEDDSWRSYVVSNDDEKEDRMDGLCCSGSTDIPTREEIAQADEVERISCDISAEDFYEQYQKTRKPVVLTGCADNWPATTRWNVPDLVARFKNESVWRARTGPWESESFDDASFEEFVESFHNPDNTAYIFDKLDHENGKSLEADYEIPPQFRDDLYSGLYSRKGGYPRNYGSMRWFCMGKKGTGAWPHMDPFQTDAWNTVIQYVIFED